MSGPEQESKSPRVGRGLKIALFLSLAVNLVVAGMFIGSWGGKKFRHDPPPHKVTKAGGSLIRALSVEDRRGIGRSILEARRADNWPGRVRTDYEKIGALLRATPFDRAALGAILETRRKAFSERGTRVERLLIDRIAGMSDAERRAYADRLDDVRAKQRERSKYRKKRHED